eukprot:3601115-Prymnesium_polylepis.1
MPRAGVVADACEHPLRPSNRPRRALGHIAQAQRRRIKTLNRCSAPPVLAACRLLLCGLRRAWPRRQGAAGARLARAHAAAAARALARRLHRGDGSAAAVRPVARRACAV